jgi:hypothetical protein
MVNDSSLGGGPTQFAFDIDSQKGVTALLSSVRASNLTPEQKNELRDLAFLYINGGKDRSVRISLQQKVSSYSLQPLKLVVDTVPEQPASPFGISRPAPDFSFSATASVASVPQSAPASVPPPPPQPIPEPVLAVPVAPPPIPTPIPVAPLPTVTEPVVAPAPPYDSALAMQRIREIKALVNERVGNPVNLVDIDNVVGREYMAALLDAMKKLNSGTSVISAMKRLEDSFKVVVETLNAHDQGVPASEPVSAPEPVLELKSDPVSPPEPASVSVPEPTPIPQPIPEPVLEVPPTPEPVFVPEPVLEQKSASVSPQVVSMSELEPVPEPIPEFIPTPQPHIKSRVNEDSVKSWNDRKDISIEESVESTNFIPVRATPAEASVSILQKKREAELESDWGPAADTLQPVGNQGRVVSLAESEKKLRSLSELPSADELSTSATGDPLFTREVDDGMQQLLLEWSLFKKSGLFGTGPKGREHPLFKKVAALQIPLLLAGRFEGATQETKQSITDYMNGWRYEQGIIYEQGETFEHYLRRVIRHILDLQKKRHNS